MAGKPETVRIRLLGGFRVSVGLRSIEEGEWRLKKAQNLIKVLALAPEGHRLHREQVMEWLWPNLEPKAAANNLRYALHVARRVLGPTEATASGYLQLRDGWLALCPQGHLWVDVEAFEEAAATARRSQELAAYRAAINLYVGDLLPEDRYEAWAEDRREGLRRLYLALLLELAGLCEEHGDFEAAVEALGRAVEAEPSHEEAHLSLMRLYAKSGRRQEALLQYERLRKVLLEELGSEPTGASRSLYQEIRAKGSRPHPRPEEHAAPLSPSAATRESFRGHNLPVERTSFVGRHDEMVEAERLLSMSRLLTLTGAGGSGKTRFALKMAKNLMGTYPEGAWLVELAPLSEEELVPQAVAQALGVREQPGRPIAAVLKDALHAKKLLLVLDNCEHLVEGVAQLVETLLDSSEGLRVLATSREALNVAGELVWRVPPLSLPDPPGDPPTIEDLARTESVRLFLERARYRDPSFELSEENAQAVGEICLRLEGIPLAIELAAARVGSLSVGQIAKRLKDSFELLKGSRTAPARQRTLSGALNWSYELLSAPERKLFGRLSVFAGGWTLEAAEAVGAGSGLEEDDVLELLLRLVEKSLVVTETSEGSALRYRMLEPIRQYAQDKLEECGKADAVRRRHAAFFLALAEEAEPALSGGSRQVTWLERLETEHANLRAALSWTLNPQDAEERAGERIELGLRLTVAVWPFWYTHGHLREGREWLEDSISKSPSATTPAKAKALNGVGYIALFQGEYGAAKGFLERSLALYRELEDDEGIASSLTYLGFVAVVGQRDLETVPALYEEAMSLEPKLEDPRVVANLLLFSGLIAASRGELERTVLLHEESLALFRKMLDVQGIGHCLNNLGLMAVVRNDYEEASALLRENLHQARESGYKLATLYSLLGLGHVAASREQQVRAARLWGAAEAMEEVFGIRITPLGRSVTGYEARLALARSRLGEAAFETAWSEGWAMTPEQAVEYALSKEEEPRTTAAVLERTPIGKSPAILTRREREVAVLIAKEMTNRQIAEELVISEHTATTHVRNILKKLGLRSRTQIGAWVAQRHLVPEEDQN